MTSDDSCPRCGEEDVSLVDPTEPEWSLDPADFDEDSEVWLCVACGWREQATVEEQLDESAANLEWLLERIGQLS